MVNKLNIMNYKKTLQQCWLPVVMALIIVISLWWINYRYGQKINEPIPQIQSYTPTYQSTLKTASWYDNDHCLGCREDRLMANGQKLAPNTNTVALNDIPLNSKITLCTPNLAICEPFIVTDRVGLDRVDIAGWETFKRFNTSGGGNGGLVQLLVIK